MENEIVTFGESGGCGFNVRRVVGYVKPSLRFLQRHC